MKQEFFLLMIGVFSAGERQIKGDWFAGSQDSERYSISQ